jgi:Mg2+ and Co2+ transporter CorA
MNILESLKTKTATTIFAVIGIIGGFFFLNRNLTGNVIIGNETTTSLVSLIGLLLIACSVVLGVYTIRKK